MCVAAGIDNPNWNNQLGSWKSIKYPRVCEGTTLRNWKNAFGSVGEIPDKKENASYFSLFCNLFRDARDEWRACTSDGRRDSVIGIGRRRDDDREGGEGRTSKKERRVIDGEKVPDAGVGGDCICAATTAGNEK